MKRWVKLFSDIPAPNFRHVDSTGIKNGDCNLFLQLTIGDPGSFLQSVVQGSHWQYHLSSPLSWIKSCIFLRSAQHHECYPVSGCVNFVNQSTLFKLEMLKSSGLMTVESYAMSELCSKHLSIFPAFSAGYQMDLHFKVAQTHVNVLAWDRQT